MRVQRGIARDATSVIARCFIRILLSTPKETNRENASADIKPKGLLVKNDKGSMLFMLNVQDYTPKWSGITFKMML